MQIAVKSGWFWKRSRWKFVAWRIFAANFYHPIFSRFILSFLPNVDINWIEGAEWQSMSSYLVSVYNIPHVIASIKSYFNLVARLFLSDGTFFFIKHACLVLATFHPWFWFDHCENGDGLFCDVFNNILLLYSFPLEGVEYGEKA